jgi:hypothetical protein
MSQFQNVQFCPRSRKAKILTAPVKYASHSTPMEYNFESIPLGRQGKRRDWAKVGVLELALIGGMDLWDKIPSEIIMRIYR